MSFDLRQFGNKLERCRTQLQLDLTETAIRTGIDSTRIANLENGNAEPTGDEVLIFADLYKQNYNFFISNQQQTASEQVDILYRKFGDDFSKEDRLAVRDFIFLCECEDFIFKNINYKIIEFDFIPSGSYYKSHGADAARSLRSKLRLKQDQIVHDPYSTFRELGIHIFRRKLSNSRISGLFINHPLAGKCVLVNYEEDIYRQNFTLAHEIGHAIFDHKESINISFSGNWKKDDLREFRANAFASNFLIPKVIFDKYDPKYLTKGQILNIAGQLQVNVEPLLIAMKEAEKIDNLTYSQYRNLKIPPDQKTDPELKNLSPGYLQAKEKVLQKGLSTFYVRKAFECYQMDIISAGRLAEMLLCDENELTGLLDLFSLKLNYEH